MFWPRVYEVSGWMADWSLGWDGFVYTNSLNPLANWSWIERTLFIVVDIRSEATMTMMDAIRTKIIKVGGRVGGCIGFKSQSCWLNWRSVMMEWNVWCGEWWLDGKGWRVEFKYVIFGEDIPVSLWMMMVLWGEFWKSSFLLMNWLCKNFIRLVWEYFKT